MKVTLKSVLWDLLLLFRAVSLSREVIIPRERPHQESELSPLRESQSKEEEEIAEVAHPSDFRGSQRKVFVVPETLEDNSEGYQHRLHFARGEEKHSGPGFVTQVQSMSHRGPEEPVCRVKLDGGSIWGPNHLEVVGLLTSYDSGFLKALRTSTWGEGELEIFGMCSSEVPHGVLSSLQHISDYLVNPRENHFLLLHLEEGRCKMEEQIIIVIFLTLLELCRCIKSFSVASSDEAEQARQNILLSQ